MGKKFKAIVELIAASNYIVVTDTASDGSVSPLYAEKFRAKLKAEDERLRLIEVRHDRTMNILADSQLKWKTDNDQQSR